MATGVSAPVLPTFTSMACTTVVAWRAAKEAGLTIVEQKIKPTDKPVIPTVSVTKMS